MPVNIQSTQEVDKVEIKIAKFYVKIQGTAAVGLLQKK